MRAVGFRVAVAASLAVAVLIAAPATALINAAVDRSLYGHSAAAMRQNAWAIWQEDVGPMGCWALLVSALVARLPIRRAHWPLVLTASGLGLAIVEVLTKELLPWAVYGSALVDYRALLYMAAGVMIGGVAIAAAELFPQRVRTRLEA